MQPPKQTLFRLQFRDFFYQEIRGLRRGPVQPEEDGERDVLQLREPEERNHQEGLARSKLEVEAAQESR